jgi:hypothetical protein
MAPFGRKSVETGRASEDRHRVRWKEWQPLTTSSRTYSRSGHPRVTSIAAAASDFNSSPTRAYTSAMIAYDACPSTSEITARGTPWASMSVAAEWRSAWNRRGLKPAFGRDPVELGREVTRVDRRSDRRREDVALCLPIWTGRELSFGWGASLVAEGSDPGLREREGATGASGLRSRLDQTETSAARERRGDGQGSGVEIDILPLRGPLDEGVNGEDRRRVAGVGVR